MLGAIITQSVTLADSNNGITPKRSSRLVERQKQVLRHRPIVANRKTVVEWNVSPGRNTVVGQ